MGLPRVVFICGKNRVVGVFSFCLPRYHARKNFCVEKPMDPQVFMVDMVEMVGSDRL
jgi:hypothetical protein